MQTQQDFTIGDSFEKTWQFDKQAVKAFATLAGDFNPLHHDEDFAKHSRFGQLIVSGTQYTAMMMGMVASYVSERKMTVGLHFDFQYKKAVYADEKIRMHWQISDIEPSEKFNGDIIHLSGILYNSENQICTTGHGRLLLLA